MNLSRRQFLGCSATAASTGLIGHLAGAEPPVTSTGPLETFVPTQMITSGPGYHWFGYYDKQQFDPTGSLVLTNEVRFEGRSPTADDELTVGYVDTKRENAFVPVGTSSAWGWQQACMLQFAGPSGQSILWNDREGDRFVCRIFDRKTQTTRTIDRPIYTISADGRTGLSADFRRINNLRPGYGYAGLADPHVDQRAPADAGVWRVDLQTGQSTLILSLADVVAIPWPNGDTHADAWHYFNHLLINPSGTRFIVLHRFRPEFDPATREFRGQFVTRMLTANLDGSDVCVLDPSGQTSHFIWKDDEIVTMWTRPIGRRFGFFDFRDQSDEINPVGQSVMTENGHNTYLGGEHRDWILNDTYPSRDLRRQTVYLFHVPSGRRFDLGHFPSPPPYAGEWRCDTHPRSSMDGETVCIDSPHGVGDWPGGRQMHLLDIRDVLRQA